MQGFQRNLDHLQAVQHARFLTQKNITSIVPDEVWYGFPSEAVP